MSSNRSQKKEDKKVAQNHVKKPILKLNKNDFNSLYKDDWLNEKIVKMEKDDDGDRFVTTNATYRRAKRPVTVWCSSTRERKANKWLGLCLTIQQMYGNKWRTATDFAEIIENEFPMLKNDFMENNTTNMEYLIYSSLNYNTRSASSKMRMFLVRGKGRENSNFKLNAKNY